MQKRRLALGAFTAVSCTPVASMTDAGTDAGYDAGSHDAGRDAGIADAGRDAGAPDAGSTDAGSTDAGSTDAGCRCARDSGVCKVPPDFPENLKGTFYEEVLCYCDPNPTVWCLDETSARCAISWGCNPAKEVDGGVRYEPDGGVYCYC